MPLFRIHYRRDGAARHMTFAGIGDPEAALFAHNVLSHWVGVPIDRLERLPLGTAQRKLPFEFTHNVEEVLRGPVGNT